MAAYYALPRNTHDVSVRCDPVEPGMVVDFSADGRPIGIEITAPSALTLEAFNGVLTSLGFPEVTAEILAPLYAA